MTEHRDVALRAVRRYVDDGMIDRAPAVAYYGILSLFPMLLIAFAVVRLLGGADAPADIARFARDEGASGPVADVLRSAADTARDASGSESGAAGVAGLVALVYGASRAFTAAGRALDVVAGERSPRRSLGRRARDLAWTLVVLVMVLTLVALALVSGRLLEEALGLVGLEGSVDVWSVARWPAALVAALLIVAVVRWSAPAGKQPPFRLLTPGMVVSVAVLLVETVGFDVYVTNFADYNSTYGAFAGGVILLLWIWLAAIAFLFGAELDAAWHERAG